MNWSDQIESVKPHVVRIETPVGFGTGFLAFYNDDKTWCAIATAAHVVQHADAWLQPIRIYSTAATEEQPLFLHADDRVIFIDQATDSAVILFFKGEFQLPEIPIALTPVNQPCGIGADIGWLGFPTLAPDTMCFFSGTVSAWQPARKAYLIDGVAINGVSGGPVFHCPNSSTVQIIGCVTAYQANRATGEALPGLLSAQDVSHFHAALEHIRNVDEANSQKKEFEEHRAGESPGFLESDTPIEGSS